MEDVEVVELLAVGGELDGTPGHGADAQRRAAAGVPVQLGEHDAVNVDPLTELLGRGHRVLAGHGVDDEEDVVRLDRAAHARQLVHELVVDVQPARGVDDRHVAVGARELDPVAGDGDGVDVRAGRIHGNPDAFGERRELVDGGGAIDVGGDEDRALAVLLEVLRELGAGRRLAGTLQTGHEDDRRRMPTEGEPRIAGAHERRELLIDDLDDLLRRGEALHHLGAQGALPDVGDEVTHDLEVDVGLEQSQTDLAHRRVDVVGGELAAPSQVLEGVLQAVGKSVEHACPRSSAALRAPGWRSVNGSTGRRGERHVGRLTR